MTLDSGARLDYKGRPGICGISYFPGTSCHRSFPSQDRLAQAYILADHNIMDTLMTGIKEKFNPDFYPALNQCRHSYFYAQTTISYPMQMALAQLLHCPLKGDLQKIYWESKTMELMALLLDTLVLDRPVNTASPVQTETDRIYEAREILARRYAHPPSLGELSRLVDLNEFKLKQGFRRIFGKTVFGCLYDHRMEKARQLLEDNRKSIKEIAWSVGYQSPGRFSDAFKRKFGVRPSVYRS